MTMKDLCLSIAGILLGVIVLGFAMVTYGDYMSKRRTQAYIEATGETFGGTVSKVSYVGMGYSNISTHIEFESGQSVLITGSHTFTVGEHVSIEVYKRHDKYHMQEKR